MPKSASDKEQLLRKIQGKRRRISAYLSRAEPRHSCLITGSIVASALAAALTAGPGVGGDGFIGAAKGLVSVGIPVWQVLCLAATLLSTTAAIANGLLKARNLTAKIADARFCDARLEGLETLVELDQVNLDRAARDYAQCLARIAHI